MQGMRRGGFLLIAVGLLAFVPTTVSGQAHRGNPFSDMSIVKSASPNSVRVGDLIMYTLEIENGGPNTANNVIVTDVFEKAVKVVSAVPSQGTCTTNPIQCNLGAMPAAGQATVTVTARPKASGKLRNTATVVSNSQDSDPSDNEDSATVQVGKARISIRKIALQKKVGVGDVITFEITLRSQSAVSLDDVKLCDHVPSGLTLLTAPGADISGNEACWKEDFLPKQKQTFKLTARADETGGVVNVGKVTGPDVAPASDKAPATVVGIAPCRC
jgi:uncharacterized repeat protein (TIGR01451 family)